MKKIFAALFVSSILLVGARQADACSVMAGFPGSNEDRYARSEIVFVGKAQSVTVAQTPYGPAKIQFEVTKVYKGDFDHAVVVTTQGSSAACGYDDAASVFKKGTVWAIYADGSLNTSSVVGNTQYESAAMAVSEVDAAAKKPTICTMEYAPVCGRKDTGIRCVTTPCPSTEDKTYGNLCSLRADDAQYLHDGECRVDSNTGPGSGGTSGSAGGGTSGSAGGSVGGSIGAGGQIPQPDDILKPIATSSDQGSSTDADKAIPDATVSVWTKFWRAVADIFVFWK